MELAKNTGVTVLLDGQGADEVIGGYPSLTFGYWYAELFASRQVTRLVSELVAFHRTHGNIASAFRYFGGAMLAPARREQWRIRYLGTKGLVQMAAPLVDREDQSPNPRERRPDQTLKRALYEALTVTSLPSLLRYGDRNSMAFSREARLPFLDHRLVEFVFSLPSDRFVSGPLTKTIQREAMHGLVPDRVLRRTDKIGFATPQREWLTGRNMTWVEDLLQASARRGLVNPRRADAEWRRLQGGASNSGNVWRIVNLELWCQRFIDAG
jgi:asparagine synthase (glutamine-hydrolysing)